MGHGGSRTTEGKSGEGRLRDLEGTYLPVPSHHRRAMLWRAEAFMHQGQINVNNVACLQCALTRCMVAHSCRFWS